MAKAMCQAVASYMGTSEDDNVSATSIGAACFVASHLMSLSFEDERKDQVTKGLVATLALNSPGNMLDLVKNPPTDEKPN